MTMLHEAQSEWHQLGTFLKVDVQSIDNGIKCNKLMNQMIMKWIADKGEAATVQAIVDALESSVISNNALAKRIKNNKEVQTTYNYEPPAMSEGTYACIDFSMHACLYSNQAQGGAQGCTCTPF